MLFVDLQHFRYFHLLYCLSFISLYTENDMYIQLHIQAASNVASKLKERIDGYRDTANE